MNRTPRFALLLAAMVLLLGCSREGFADSLSREEESSSSSVEPSKPAPAAGAVYQLSDQTADGIEGEFPIPVAGNEENEKAVKRISRSIRSVFSLLPAHLADGGEAPALSVKSEVVKNDGIYFSLSFAVTAKVGEKEEHYGWGMTFDASTGASVGLDRSIEPKALAVLLLDGASCELLGVEGEQAEKQRDYLAEQGVDALSERLLASDSGDCALLLNASYYLDGSRVVALFSAPQEIGGVVRASTSA